MNIQPIRAKLLADLKWWEAVAERHSEYATVDPHSNFNLRLAQGKLTTICKALERIDSGIFGGCEKCGEVIELERLEILLDSDCHYCAICASADEYCPPQSPERRPHCGQTYSPIPASNLSAAG